MEQPALTNETLRNLARLRVETYGSIVRDNGVDMFPWDRLELHRVLHLTAISVDDAAEELSGQICFRLDEGDGSSDKGQIDDGVLTLNERAAPGDCLRLLASYAGQEEAEESAIAVRIKTPVPIEIIACKPVNGVIFIGGTVNLDTYMSVFTGSLTREYDQVSGFVRYELKHGADIARLDGSVLTLKPRARQRDSIVVRISYEYPSDGGPVLLTNEFPLQVVTSVQQGGSDEYDETIVNGATPLDVLEAIYIEQGPEYIRELPLLKWQRLNLYKDVIVRGWYDNPNNKTLLTGKVSWRVAPSTDGAAAWGEITLNEELEPVFAFTNTADDSETGFVELIAEYEGVRQSLHIGGFHAEQLVVEAPVTELLPGEELSLKQNQRIKLAGLCAGKRLEVAGDEEVEWKLAPESEAEARLQEERLELISPRAGVSVRLIAAYKRNPSVSAEAIVRFSEYAEVHIDSSRFQRYNQKVSGFNDNRWYVNASGYTDTSRIELIKPLKPAVLRYPGGSKGNHHHWEIAGYIPGTLREKNKMNYLYMLQDSKNNMAYSLDDFMTYVEEVGAEPLVQINVYTADVNSAVAMIRYAKRQGYAIKYWEMGNEFHLQGGPGAPHRNAFPLVQDYMRKAKEIALALKAEDSSIQIMMVGERTLSEQGRVPDELFMLRWAAGLQEDPFYDMVSNHWYWYGTYDPQLSSYEDEVKEALTIAPRLVGVAAQRARERYPGKGVAFTEWGILPDNKRVNKTLLNALFDADVLLNLIKYDNIVMSNRHVLISNQFELIGYAGKPEDNTHQPVPRATYYPFALLNNLFAKAGETAEPLPGAGRRLTPICSKDELLSELALQAFRDSAGGKLYVAAINKGGEDKPLKLAIDGKAWEKEVKVSYITAETLTDASGNPVYTLQRNNGGIKYKGAGFIADNPLDGTQHVTLHEARYGPGAPVVLPRYSVAVLELAP